MYYNLLFGPPNDIVNKQIKCYVEIGHRNSQACQRQLQPPPQRQPFPGFRPSLRSPSQTVSWLLCRLSMSRLAWRDVGQNGIRNYVSLTEHGHNFASSPKPPQSNLSPDKLTTSNGSIHTWQRAINRKFFWHSLCAKLPENRYLLICVYKI